MAAFGSKKLNRAMVSLVVLLAVVIMFAVITATAWAVPELRRIETGNINKPTDIHAIGGSDSRDKKELGSEEEHGTEEEESDEHKEDSDEHEKEDEHEDEGAESDHEEDSHDAEEEDDRGGAVTEEHDEEPGGGEHGGEAHHPAWMIPGWQSIFASLAVVYFGLALKFLPKIMAKEEHH